MWENRIISGSSYNVKHKTQLKLYIYIYFWEWACRQMDLCEMRRVKELMKGEKCGWCIEASVETKKNFFHGVKEKRKVPEYSGIDTVV